jgi:hypothetical protein
MTGRRGVSGNRMGQKQANTETARRMGTPGAVKRSLIKELAAGLLLPAGNFRDNETEPYGTKSGR